MVNLFLQPLTAIVIVGASWFATIGQVHLSAPREFQLKAAFFHKFPLFLEWPGRDESVPPLLCVMGETPVRQVLQSLILARGDNTRLASIEDGTDPRSCSLLFVAESEAAKLDEILRRVDGFGVITVSDIPNFASRGGAIEFIVEENRVRFVINQTVAERQGVRVSSKLSSLARRQAGQ